MDKVELINEIKLVFKDVELEDGIGIWEAQGLDDYADNETLLKLREKDERRNWNNLSYKDISHCESSLSFFDAKGMLFHLPVYLIFDLLQDEIYKSQGIYVPDILFTLSHNLEGEYQKERFSLLNSYQIKCVIHFLEYQIHEIQLVHEQYALEYGSSLDSLYSDLDYIALNKALLSWKERIEKEIIL